MKIDFDNRLKALEKKHQDEIEKNLLTIRLFQDSNIVQSNEKELILSWFDKRPKSIDLLLNANIDDNFYKSFFDKCRNKANTMIFVKTTDNVRIG